ncbi:hypothetical protein [Klebsiella oxytoca]|uniref:hypothetical protein n=1 Tax=Klebsiella oxytoca TaxID=571 RepID=UPI00192D689F|nr:hypothetical protein [Klebsiella oxytoca]ELT9681933.1 hypothetical protein [Klebsiella oxytoca]ELT9975553.1 hypothetical protein [Klebsiella oxytoca]MBL6252050.1 hypothetical protein [Klebsiella oxytoca]MBL6269455.1 hypothetical protein [Klebsiella oxytoca]MDU2797592.1 hypothetical protein [Klebsiella oxytoca]
MAGVFVFGYRLKHGADECLSTTLYPKESGLTASFLIQRKPSSAMAGVFASGFGLKHWVDECLSTTLYPKESGLTVSLLIQRKPSSEMAGVFASGFGLKQRKRAVCGKPGCHQPHHDSYGHAFSSPGFIYFK